MDSAPNDQNRFKEAADAFDAVELQNQSLSHQTAVVSTHTPSKKGIQNIPLLHQIRSFTIYLGNPDSKGPLVFLAGLVVTAGVLKGFIPPL
jgi:hypothetical protein